MAAKNKVRRYKNLIRDFSNWPQYLRFKVTGGQDSFNFHLRNSFFVEVPRQMLSPFRECFFDQIYFKHLPENAIGSNHPTIIDIGANAGFFALFMFSQYPTARIYSFEPMPFNFSVLSNYHQKHSSFDWHIDQRAVSSSNQAITLHASNLESFTTMASVFDQVSRRESIEVEAVSLHEIVAHHAIEQIDILKLDCEGAEYDIIYALPEELLKLVKVLLIETHLGSQTHENTDALAAHLRQQGFVLHSLSEDRNGYIWAWRT